MVSNLHYSKPLVCCSECSLRATITAPPFRQIALWRGVSRAWAIRKLCGFCDTAGMSRARKYRHLPGHSGTLPDDLYAYADAPDVPRRCDLPDRVVTDDWPDLVPVSDAEITVFEAWFERELDALLRDQDTDLV